MLLVIHAFEMQTVRRDGQENMTAACVVALCTCVTVFSPWAAQVKDHSDLVLHMKTWGGQRLGDVTVRVTQQEDVRAKSEVTSA